MIRNTNWLLKIGRVKLPVTGAAAAEKAAGAGWEGGSEGSSFAMDTTCESRSSVRRRLSRSIAPWRRSLKNISDIRKINSFIRWFFSIRFSRFVLFHVEIIGWNSLPNRLGTPSASVHRQSNNRISGLHIRLFHSPNIKFSFLRRFISIKKATKEQFWEKFEFAKSFHIFEVSPTEILWIEFTSFIQLVREDR